MHCSKEESRKDAKSSIVKRISNWVALTIAGIVFEALLRDILYDTGIEIIKVSQSSIQESQVSIFFLQLLSFAANKWSLITGLILIFNFEDFHCTVVISMAGGLASIGTGFFKLIYRNPRPYFHEPWVKVYDCETGYGNPSGHSIVATSIYLSYLKIIHLKWKSNPTYNRNKRFIHTFFYVFIILITFSRLALGAHSLNQILLGALFGYQIYSFFFYVCRMHLKGREIKIILKRSTAFTVFVSVLLVNVISFIIFNYLIKINEGMDTWVDNINLSCPDTPYSKILDFEAYFMVSASSSIIGMYLGIWFDVRCNLKNDLRNWIYVNFGKCVRLVNPEQKKTNRMETVSDCTSEYTSLSEKENSVKKNCFSCQKESCICVNLLRWNQTDLKKSLLRIIVICASLAPAFCLNFIISSTSSINQIFILKNLIPYAATNFVLFGFSRRICVKLGLANDLEFNLLTNQQKAKKE